MIPLLALAATSLAQVGDHPSAQHARGDVAQYFNDSDYPPDAFQRHEEGVTSVALDIDAAGRVSSCRVTQSSGSAALDEATCRIARARVQLEPARDRRGRPIPDRVSERIRWVLPDETRRRALINLASYISDADYPVAAIRAGEQGTVEFQLQIDTDGRVSGCAIVSSSGSAALDEATCRIMRARPRFAPAHDANGNPVPDTMKARIRWVLPPAELLNLTPLISAEDYPAAAIRRREQGRVEFALSISPDGRVAHCTVTRTSGSALLDARTCELVRARGDFRPTEGATPQELASAVGGFVEWVLPD